MNDRIEELIVAYLHRGSTPEQERELFEACKTDAATANVLRQHLIMSLKLRQLRDSTTVPLEVQNSLLSRINETVVPEDAVRAASPAIAPLRRGFGWAHLLGASITAAAAVVVFFLSIPGKPAARGPENASVTIRDTVTMTRTDTVFQIRNVRTPVYITRNEQPRETASPSPGIDRTAEYTQQNVPLANEDDAVDLAPIPVQQPSIAEAQPRELPSFLDQYNTMLVSVEKVHLTSNDRVRF